jgi:hypothetical protein
MTSIFFLVKFFHPSIKGERVLTPLTDHQHIIGNVPKDYFKKMKQKGFSEDDISLSLTLYHQLLESMMVVLNTKAGEPPYIKLNNDRTREAVVNFLSRESIPETIGYFQSLQKGESPQLGVKLKKNNVGLRSSETYSWKNTWGLEFRFLGFNLAKSDEDFSKVVQKTHEHLSKQEFPIDLESISRFRKKHSNLKVEDIAVQSWWRQSADDLISSHEDGPLKTKMTKASETIKRDFERPPVDNGGWKSLFYFMFYRWDKHPLLFGDTEFTERIVRTQERYLDEFLANRQSPGSFSQLKFDDFIDESGVMEFFEKILY